MKKRIIAITLAVAMLLSFSASAAGNTGFSGDGWYTDTANMYYFETFNTFSLMNKEVDDYPDFDEIRPGTDIYLPLYVLPDDGDEDIPVTDKMVKNDNVTVSAKVISGGDYVGQIELVDTKKLKLKDLPNGMHIKIPLGYNYDKTGRTSVEVRLKISVNNRTYSDTEIAFRCVLQSEADEISHNSVYGAKQPSLFKATSNYNGEATFDFGNDIKFTGKVKAGSTYLLNLSREPVMDLKAMYPDAWLDFYIFLGTAKTFSSIGYIEIPVNLSSISKKSQQPELYVYYIKDSALYSLGPDAISFDSKTNKLYIKAQMLGSYVLSDRALLRQITPDSNKNILRFGYADSL